MIARFNHGFDKHSDNSRVEWWDIYDSDGRFVKCVSITYDLKWFRHSGSINDLKEMAIAEAISEQESSMQKVHNS